MTDEPIHNPEDPEHDRVAIESGNGGLYVHPINDPDTFYNLPPCWAMVDQIIPGAVPWPGRIITKDEDKKLVMVAPDNDRGCIHGEAYWLPEDAVKLP